MSNKFKIALVIIAVAVSGCDLIEGPIKPQPEVITSKELNAPASINKVEGM